MLLAFNAGYGMILDAAEIVPPNVVDELGRIAPMPVIFVWAVVFAPIVEELYFRGRLLDALDARVGRSWSGAFDLGALRRGPRPTRRSSPPTSP